MSTTNVYYYNYYYHSFPLLYGYCVCSENKHHIHYYYYKLYHGYWQ